MTSTYSKGTRVWLPDDVTGWVPGTVTSILIPSDRSPTAEVAVTVQVDGDDELRTLKFSFAALESAGNALQPAIAAPPGQDSPPPLRNPPLLESSEDLASLSNLNEPSGQLGYRM